VLLTTLIAIIESIHELAKKIGPNNRRHRICRIADRNRITFKGKIICKQE
jgi:hypothetical protein